jgi:hypothetical protein
VPAPRASGSESRWVAHSVQVRGTWPIRAAEISRPAQLGLRPGASRVIIANMSARRSRTPSPASPGNAQALPDGVFWAKGFTGSCPEHSLLLRGDPALAHAVAQVLKATAFPADHCGHHWTGDRARRPGRSLSPGSHALAAHLPAEFIRHRRRSPASGRAIVLSAETCSSLQKVQVGAAPWIPGEHALLGPRPDDIHRDGSRHLALGRCVGSRAFRCRQRTCSP